jgi:hypothetical protein
MIQTKQQDEYAGFSAHIEAHLESIKQGIAKRQEAEKCEKGNGKGHTSAVVIHLPLWPEAVRGAPNVILRSALFPAIEGKDRQHLVNRIIASFNGTKIIFTGEQLDQSDLDVWEQVIHLVMQNPLGSVCEFKAGAFLKTIGRSWGKANYQWLDRSLSRLTACEVRFERSGFTYGRGLITSYDIDVHTRTYRVCIDSDIARLFLAGWTAIDCQERQALKRKPLALWLHSFYASHAEPLPVKVETLRSLSGSRDKTLRSYRQKLRRALTELKSIGALASWKINSSDLVVVDRGEAKTASQKRHLMRLRFRKNKRRLTPQSRKNPRSLQEIISNL